MGDRLFIYEAARVFDATTLTGSYQNLGAVAANAVRQFQIYNTSDVDVLISLDGGTTDNLRIPGGATFDSNDYGNPGSNEAREYVLAKATQVKIKQATGAGTTGNIIMHFLA